MLTNYDSWSDTRGCYVTTNPRALDPVDMYRRLAAEFNLDPFSVMMDASIVILANGYHMLYRESDSLCVMHPGALEHVEAKLYDEYLTESLR